MSEPLPLLLTAHPSRKPYTLLFPQQGLQEYLNAPLAWETGIFHVPGNSLFPDCSIISAHDEKRGTIKCLGQEHNRVSGDDKMMVSWLVFDSESLGFIDEALGMDEVPWIVEQSFLAG